MYSVSWWAQSQWQQDEDLTLVPIHGPETQVRSVVCFVLKFIPLYEGCRQKAMLVISVRFQHVNIVVAASAGFPVLLL